ncbi:MAG: hypothetical protein HY791_18270 [Deltaproteobacteria bacterium]|nr:hypothetical protein [Deltaproteobacteria bacterium]
MRVKNLFLAPAFVTVTACGGFDNQVADSELALEGAAIADFVAAYCQRDGIPFPPERVIVGTDGDDVLSGLGDLSDDCILGLGGNDTILGHAGDDILIGFDGDDFIDGEAGNDVVFGFSGNDILHGGDGADLVRGNLGDDSVFGDNGDDIVQGGVGRDRLFGGLGNDTVTWDGPDSDPQIDGGGGNDQCRLDATRAANSTVVNANGRSCEALIP